MEFRSTDETIQASVRTLIKFGKLPAMESQLSPVAAAAIARELHEWAPSGVIGGGELISWLIVRSSYQQCPTRAVRDAELLQKIGVIASSKQISSILPSNPAKMLAVNVVEEAGKLGQFSIVFSAATPRNAGAEVSRAVEAPLPAEYQAVVDQTLAELLQAASAGIAEGWENVKTEMDVTIQRRKGKTTVFKGTTGIKYASQAIQEHATLIETLPSIDPLFQEGVILKKLDDTADIRLCKYEGRSCLVVSNFLFFFLFFFCSYDSLLQKQKTHFVVLVKRLAPLADGTRVTVIRSVTYPDAPAVPGSMLGMLASTGWVIRAPDDKGICQSTYIVAVNFDGIPQAVVNIAAKQIPLVAARLRLYLTGR
jgi:hypothetical protein